MRIGSLFSGIGGLELGLEWSGIGRTVWQVEQSEFCRNVLAKHWPQAERFEDVRAVGASVLGPVDLICGGFPCQDVSSAGKGAGLAGERSGLWYQFARIVGEMQPEWVVVENVASGAQRWVDAVRSGLAELGYDSVPFPVSARDVGAPHIRARVFVVARLSADAEREQLRKQSGGGSGSDRQGSRVTLHSSETRDAGNGNGNGKPAVAIDGQVARVRSVASGSPAWSTPPEFRGVDDGVPSSLVLPAFGNAVVPQCAEVVGWLIRELTGP